MATFRQTSLTGVSNAGGVGTNRDCRRYSFLSIDNCWTCEQQVRQSTTVQFIAQTRRISDAIFITTCSTHDHDEEKTTEQNLFVRSGKSEAELALDVLNY